MSSFHRRHSPPLQLVLGLFGALGLAPTGPAAALTPGALFQAVQDQVVVVEFSRTAKEAPGQASALVLGGHRYATTCDVVANMERTVIVAGSRTLPAQGVLQDPGRNLCVVEANGASAPGVSRREAPAVVGERVYAVANSLGLGLGITEGLVSGIRRLGNEEYIQFTAPIAPGAEGGGLFDGAGQLLGIIDYRWRDGQNVNFAGPAKWLDEIATRHDQDRQRSRLRDQVYALAGDERWQDLLAPARAWTRAYPDDGEAWLWLGTAAEAGGDDPLADQAYREVRRLDSQSLRGGLGLVRVLLRQKRWPEARTTARELLNLRREDAEVWASIAHAEMALGNLAEAEQAYRKTMDLAPYHEAAYRGLADIAQRRGDLDTQEAIWRRLAAIQPHQPWPALRLAEVQLWRNDGARALALSERVLQDHPRNADALFSKGRALAKLGRPLAAIAALKQSLELKPSRPDGVWALLGDLHSELRMPREAVADYRHSVDIAPDVPDWTARLAIALKDSGQFAEAMKRFQEWTENTPGDAFGWRQIGFVLAYQNRNRESAEALEHALTIDPRQGKVWHALMEQYHQLGRTDDLRRAYQQLRAVDPEHADLAYKSLILPLEVPQ